MTVEVCTRVGVRVSPPAPGALKEEPSSPGRVGGSPSPSHETREASQARSSKFMITDILAQQKPATSPQQLISSNSAHHHIPNSAEEPKDLRIPRPLHLHEQDEDEDVDVDLEGDISNDEDDSDLSKFSFSKIKKM